jgi:hypothetical protein
VSNHFQPGERDEARAVAAWRYVMDPEALLAAVLRLGYNAARSVVALNERDIRVFGQSGGEQPSVSMSREA